ncbi:MAG: ribonuclease III [Deltaproteobacteria bacterium]|nr:MAG: ribonuclease III [Deltaproteobacteria bacterium]
MSPDVSDTAVVEALIGHRFGDPALLETALTHPSRTHEVEGGESNERLEFLGDAVLDLVVAQALFDAHPEWTEGELTRARAALVNTRQLAERSRALGFDEHVRLGRTEQRTGGADKDSILGNLFEAIVGAVYLDGGLAPVRTLVQNAFGSELGAETSVPERDPKTAFQEWAHDRFRKTPAYRTLVDTGVADDERRFTIEVSIDAEEWGRGVARTKRQAERLAAEAALERALRESPSA